MRVICGVESILEGRVMVFYRFSGLRGILGFEAIVTEELECRVVDGLHRHSTGPPAIQRTVIVLPVPRRMLLFLFLATTRQRAFQTR